MFSSIVCFLILFLHGEPLASAAVLPVCFVPRHCVQAMGKRGGPRPKLLKAQDDGWLHETAERLEKRRAMLEQDHQGEHHAEEAWQRVARDQLRDLCEGKPASASGKRESPLSGAETAELIYRSTSEGLTLSAYTPWQHTGMIEGRPVQVQISFICVSTSEHGFFYKRCIVIFVFAQQSLHPRASRLDDAKHIMHTITSQSCWLSIQSFQRC